MKKAIETLLGSSVILVGKTADMLKDQLSKIPNIKITEINSEKEQIKLREDKQAMMNKIKKIGLISIPVLAGVSMLAKTINNANEKKRINDEIDSIDEDSNIPYKLKPVELTAEDIKIKNNTKKGFNKEVSTHIAKRIHMKFNLDDYTKLQCVLESLFKSKDKSQLIKYLVEEIDGSTLHLMILSINHNIEIAARAAEAFEIFNLLECKLSSTDIDDIYKHVEMFKLLQLVLPLISNIDTNIDKQKLSYTLLDTPQKGYTELINLLNENNVPSTIITHIILCVENHFQNKK